MTTTEPELDTVCGRLRGVCEDGVRRFLGVPYASAPARFRPAEPARSWSGVRDAAAYGPSSWQASTTGMEEMLALWGIRPESAMDEDCLVLNVWAPDHVAEPVPVIVFLHGGGYSMGSGSAPAYCGQRIARRGEAVVITVNHRLGVLGHLYLADLFGSDFESSGFNGILDIVEALRWVRENIASLGGDPNRVLVYGQSGGGAKTAALFATPTSSGLFHTAAILSTPIVTLQSASAATVGAERLLHHLGISTSSVDPLLETPAGQLVDAHLAVGDPLSAFQPVLDGTFAIEHPLDAVAGRRADVPLLIGTTRDEYATFAPKALVPAGADDAWVAEQLRPVVGADIEELVDAYRSADPRASAHSLLVAVGTDARFRIGSLQLADAHASAGTERTWMYRFDWEATREPFVGTAPHGIDTPFFSDNIDTASLLADGPRRHELAAQASGALVALATHGSPQHPGLPAWPTYDTATRATLLFNVDATVVDDPNRMSREAWKPEIRHGRNVTDGR